MCNAKVQMPVETENSLPRVSKPPEVPPEEFAMLALARIPGLSNGYARMLYWWLLRIGQGRAVVWPGAAAASTLIGVSRQHVHRAMSQLMDLNLVQMGGCGVQRTARALVPDEVDEDLMTAHAEFISRAVPSRALPPVSVPRKKREPKPEQPDPTTTVADLSTQEPDVPVSVEATEPKAGKPKLSSENMKVICSSHEAMLAYLLYGMPGVSEADPEKRKLLTPSNLNWRQFQKGTDFNEESLGVKEWKANHFVGFFWFKVSYWRHVNNVPQALPIYGKLAGNMAQLMKQMTKWQLFNYITVVTMHFDLLCCMVGKIADNMILDEQALTHASVRNTAQQYMGVGEHQQAAYHDQYKDMVEARRQRYAK